MIILDMFAVFVVVFIALLALGSIWVDRAKW
jgi:hypothetical protein